MADANDAAAGLAATAPGAAAPAPAAPAVSGVRARYQLVRPLGRGGVGEVTLERDTNIDRPVALKRLLAGVTSDHVRQRFDEEIRTVGHLEHPNIPPIHDVGLDAEGRQYFVMRYVEGETLDKIIAKLARGDAECHRLYSFEYRVQVFLGVLNAIHYAHARGILHRDIKPSNIMVGPFGEVVVMDWGIAKKRDAVATPREPIDTAATLDGAAAAGDQRQRMFQTCHGTLIGTPAYMSPEQARGRVDLIDERSDLYSLSALFYELLTLCHYLPGKTTVEEMLAGVISETQEHAQHLSHPHQARVPVELSWFLTRGLAKDPAQRFQSIGEMIGELQRAVSGSFKVQCYVSFMKRGGSRALRRVDTNPRTTLAVLLVVSGFAVLGIYQLVQLLLR